VPQGIHLKPRALAGRGFSNHHRTFPEGGASRNGTTSDFGAASPISRAVAARNSGLRRGTPSALKIACPQWQLPFRRVFRGPRQCVRLDLMYLIRLFVGRHVLPRLVTAHVCSDQGISLGACRPLRTSAKRLDNRTRPGRQQPYAPRSLNPALESVEVRPPGAWRTKPRLRKRVGPFTKGNARHPRRLIGR
jgi:hypothetical protein